MSILCYHAVQAEWESPLAVDPDDFKLHCSWLKASRRIVTLDEAVAHLESSGRLPRRSVALTFDDGFASLHEHAWSLLRSGGIPATVFLVARTLSSGQDVDWVDDPPPFPLHTLTEEQVLEMQDAGMRFESHSNAHQDLTTLSEAECLRDLREAREVLEAVLSRPVRYLAYPRGRHAPHVRRAAQRAGYTHAFTLPDAPEKRGPWSLPRAGIYRGNSVRELGVKTAPWYLPARTSKLSPLLRLAITGARSRSGRSASQVPRR